MALFEGYERKIDKINGVLAQYGLNSVEECRELCKAKGFDPYEIVKGIQPIAFEDVAWAYCVGAAIAMKKGVKTAAEAAEAIGIGLQAFCIPGSVAEDRKVGLGHGNLGAMLLRDETKCFAFLAGHESFAAAEGAIGIARSANKARKEPLRVILNGLGKDAAQIISRINGFTYVQTQFDYYTSELLTPMASGLLSAATALMMSARALPSCTRKAWTFPSLATPPTPPASSILWPALTRRSASSRARSTSLWLPAAARAVPCIRITWLPVLLPTA